MTCLPVAGEDEFRLFARLIRLNGGQFKEEQMAFDYLEYCDGKQFPQSSLSTSGCITRAGLKMNKRKQKLEWRRSKVQRTSFKS
jgi:hypothetical protein